ncbi:hypothetical protein SAMD00019534_072420, partial [Acytostelium subglobosum LB1]|uniref:hypothetical protein n=1 Tax=Acytostelium subglobosum LB1 TaxID=1410327 RepID=UPI000644D253
QSSSLMSVLPKETIKVIAECVGLSNLNDEIATQLASDVEYRIREIAQESIKFMKHSKREYLTTEDINHALKLRNIEVLYGYGASEPHRFSKVLSPTQAIYFIHDRELLFQDILAQPLPKCPREPSLAAHWLALEGVQPLIPQNPPPQSQFDTFNKKLKMDGTANGSASGGAGGSGSGSGSGAVSTVTSEPLQPASTSIDGVPSAIVKPTVKHVLSKEIQMFYEKIVSAVKGDNQDLFEAVLVSLKQDSSLHQLLPYFTNFISLQVTQNLTDLNLLTRLMRMSRAILESEHLKAEFYLHQMMPPIVTCLVGRKLCHSPNENHWQLRDYVANVLQLICRKYGQAYPTLQSRLTKTLTQTLYDTSKPLTTHYGAIVGLAALGRNTVHNILLPYVPKYYKQLLDPELHNDSNPAKQFEAERVYNALMVAVGNYMSWLSEGENILAVLDMETQRGPVAFDYDSILATLRKVYAELFDIFGEKLMVYLKRQDAMDTTNTTNTANSVMVE